MSRFEEGENKKLRDKFAGMAMQSLIADPDNVQDVVEEGFSNIGWFAYKVSDAMIEARK